MPEAHPWAEEQPRRFGTFAQLLLQDCYRNSADTNLSEGQQLARRDRRYGDAAIGEETVSDDLRLLFQAVAIERFARRQAVRVAAEGVAHQRQVERPLGLRLPDMGH